MLSAVGDAGYLAASNPGCSYTISPPTIVSSTVVASIRCTGTRMMSSDSTTRSASLPGSIDPFNSSSNVRNALPMVAARSASSRVIR